MCLPACLPAAAWTDRMEDGLLPLPLRHDSSLACGSQCASSPPTYAHPPLSPSLPLLSLSLFSKRGWEEGNRRPAQPLPHPHLPPPLPCPTPTIRDLPLPPCLPTIPLPHRRARRDRRDRRQARQATGGRTWRWAGRGEGQGRTRSPGSLDFALCPLPFLFLFWVGNSWAGAATHTHTPLCTHTHTCPCRKTRWALREGFALFSCLSLPTYIQGRRIPPPASFHVTASVFHQAVTLFSHASAYYALNCPAAAWHHFFLYTTISSSTPIFTLTHYLLPAGGLLFLEEKREACMHIINLEEEVVIVICLINEA